MKGVTVPHGVTVIESSAFGLCYNMTTVYLPHSVTKIDSWAFNYCSSLSEIYFDGTSEEWEGIEKGNGWDSDTQEYILHCKDISITFGHNLTLVAEKAPTCTEDGHEEYYTCEYCDRWFEDSDATEEISDKTSVVIEKTGHDMTYYEQKEATCSEKGNTPYYICKNCDKWFEDGEGESEIINKTTVFIKKIPHSFKDNVCTECGADRIQPTAGLLYIDRGEYAELTGIGAASGDIIIADEYNGKPVLSIAAGVFAWSSLPTSIYIPDTVIAIGDGAFQGCSNVTSIYISENLTVIGKNVFYGCGMASVVIPDSVILIEEGAFGHCDKLKGIIIPDNVTSIGKNAFSWCRALKSVTIGTSVKSIGEYAFELCSELESIVIPENVTSIGDNAFEDCTTLKSVTLSKNITSFGKKVFNNCSLLANIYFDGTQAEWYDMIRGGSLGSVSWYRIYCTDGEIHVTGRI